MTTAERSIVFLFVVVTLHVTGAFEITAVQENQNVHRGNNGTFYYRIVPWPPPCPPCKPNNPEYAKYETVNIFFINDTSGDTLCEINYYNGTYDDSHSEPCSSNNPRLLDYVPDTVDGVTMRLMMVTLFDGGPYTLEIQYGAPPQSATSTMVVEAPPGSPSIDGPQDVNEGETVRYTCTVSNAYPPPELEWRRQSGGSNIIPPVEYTQAEEWYEDTISVIEFVTLYTDHGVSFVCSAFNYLNANNPSTASVALNVIHTPKSTLKPCENPDIAYRVVEGETATFTCQISANPALTSIHWRQGTAPDQLNEIAGTEWNQTVYSEHNVQRNTDLIWYGCDAQNSEGAGATSVCHIDVQYPPEGDEFETQEVAEGDRVEVSCEADANPPVDTYRWKRESDLDFNLLNMTLVIDSMSIEDNDGYACTAINTLTPTDGSPYTHIFPRSLDIYIPHSPMWRQYSLNKFTGRMGEDVTLVCDVISFPRETAFDWRHDGSSGSAHQQSTSEDPSNELTISDVSESDLGTYTCTAENREGKEQFEIQLLEPGVPDAPQHCVEISAETYKASFSCVPGYDGGGTLEAEAEVSVNGGNRRWVPTSSELRGDDLLVHVEDLDAGLNHTVYIYGKNEHGKSSDTCITYVKTLGEAVPPDDGDDPGIDVGLVVGLTIGAVILIILIVLIVGFAYYKYEPRIKDDKSGNAYLDLSRLVGDSSTSDSIGTRYAQAGGHANVRRGYYDNTGFVGDHQNKYPEYVNHPAGKMQVDLEPHGPEDKEELDSHRRQSTADNNMMVKADVHTGKPNRSSYSGSSESTSVSGQNKRNEAYELRNEQADIAGMGALSQRSALAHGDKKKHNKRVTIVDPDGKDGAYGGDWEFPRDRVYLREKLGEGAFGEVWKAAANAIAGQPGMTTVAVKTLRDEAEAEERLALLKELRVMQDLPPHLNVISLLGCCTKQDPVLILMEYASMGSLLEFLRISRNPPESARRLTTRDLVSFSLDVAAGMEHVSVQGLLHRDLATRNVLLDERLVAKVADFGLARDIVNSRQYESKTQRRLPIRWMAPESLFDNVYSTKSDAWSFGILLWEVVTLGSSPYPGLTGPHVMDRIQRGYRMEKPRHCSDHIYAMMRACWEERPAQRPGFRRMRQDLEKALDDLDKRPDSNKFVFHMQENMFSILQDMPGEKC